MMAVFYSFFTLLLCLVTGGGNDLLDYLPTEAYWQEKKVDVSLEKMVAEVAERPAGDVAGLVNDLGLPDAAARDAAAVKIRDTGGPAAIKALTEAADSPDGEVRRRARTLLLQIGADGTERSVRRLMAIRTLGEIGKPEALAALRPLLDSKELFVADYAQVAIARIEGKPSSAADRAVSPRVAEDVWMLPKACRTVGQLVPRRGNPVGLAELIAAGPKGADPALRNEDAAGVARMILSLADKLGNVRIDAATFGIVGTLVNVGELAGPNGEKPATGYVTLVVRGRYNSEWVRALARAERVPSTDVDGVEVFQPDGESAWILASDELFVYMAAPNPDDLPMREMAAAVKQGKGTLAGDAAAKQLVEAIDTKQVLWAAAVITPEQRALPVAGVFDTLGLVGTREGRTLSLKLQARGANAGRVKDAAADINKHVQAAAEFLSGIRGIRALDMSVELLRSVKAEAAGDTATVTAKLETTPAAILSMPALIDEEPQPEPDTPANPRLRR